MPSNSKNYVPKIRLAAAQGRLPPIKKHTINKINLTNGIISNITDETCLHCNMSIENPQKLARVIWGIKKQLIY